MIEIYGTGLRNTSYSSSPELAIWIGFGLILEQDYDDLSSNYPEAPLAATFYITYGLQWGYFVKVKENWNVHNNFWAYENNVASDERAVFQTMNQLPLRYYLHLYSRTDASDNAKNTAAYNTETAYVGW